MADISDLSAWENVDRDEAIRQAEHFHAENLRNLRAVESLRAEVKRLREVVDAHNRQRIEVADVLENLEIERDRLRGALEEIADLLPLANFAGYVNRVQDIAEKALSDNS